MIAERTVIRMLLYGHNLYTVVTVLDDTGKYVFFEFTIGTDLFSILRHTYMTFVYHKRSDIRFEFLFLECICRFGIPYLCREYFGIIILNYSLGPCRYTFSFTSVPVDMHLIQVAMFHRILTQLDFPVACPGYTFQFILIRFYPVVEITDKINIRGIGSPLAKHPSFISLM